MATSLPSSSPSVQGVLFDVDGVLVDSLDAHLRICADKSREYGLTLAIPDAIELRAMVKRGVVISPMKSFFLAVGFPEPLAEKADASYRKEFVTRYSPLPFSGVGAMLEQLGALRVPLGMVTSNTIANVRPSLGSLMEYFDSRCLFGRDESSAPSKSEALREAASTWGLPTDRLLYVGDQRGDFEAAGMAGVQFVGVTYGWEIDHTDVDLDQVDSPGAVAAYVIERYGQRRSP